MRVEADVPAELRLCFGFGFDDEPEASASASACFVFPFVVLACGVAFVDGPSPGEPDPDPDARGRGGLKGRVRFFWAGWRSAGIVQVGGCRYFVLVWFTLLDWMSCR